MTEDEYWDIVAKVDWPGICDDPNAHKDVGKEILLKLLPTLDVMETFRNIHSTLLGNLINAMEQWRCDQIRKNLNWPGWGIGDDGFDDLTNHILGCGKAEWKATIADPSKAYDRINNNKRAKGPRPQKLLSEGFVESFSYCIPYDEDYDAALVRLKRTVSELEHWMSMAATTSDKPRASSMAMNEVTRIIDEIVTLEAQVQQETGIVSDYTANTDERIHAMKITIAKRTLADFFDSRIKLEMKIKEATENLDSLLTE